MEREREIERVQQYIRSKMFGALSQQNRAALLLSRNNNALLHQLPRMRPRCVSCPSMPVNHYSVLQSLRNSSVKSLLHRRICQFNKAQQHAPTNQIMIRRTKATTLSQYNSQTAAATRTSHPILRLLHQSLQHTLLKPRSLPLPRYISPQHFTFTLSELCGHSSFILGKFVCLFLYTYLLEYVIQLIQYILIHIFSAILSLYNICDGIIIVAASYYSQDFLELRIMAVLGSTSMLFFTYFHPHGRVLWLPLKWNILFIAINSMRIGKVFYERYKAQELSPELKEFRREELSIIDMVDYYKLVNIAQEEVFEEGALIVQQVRYMLMFGIYLS